MLLQVQGFLLGTPVFLHNKKLVMSLEYVLDSGTTTCAISGSLLCVISAAWLSGSLSGDPLIFALLEV